MACSIAGCGRPIHTRGWCKRHYIRWWRHGHPEAGGLTPGTSLRDNFNQKFRKESRGYLTPCWTWTAYANKGGYGVFAALAHYGRSVLAHRFIFEHLYGSVPDGLDLDHLCRTRNCVNPDHLEVVTRQENLLRGTYARITHCPQGHPYDVENTSYTEGHRRCKTCNREKAKRNREAKRLLQV